MLFLAQLLLAFLTIVLVGTAVVAVNDLIERRLS